VSRWWLKFSRYGDISLEEWSCSTNQKNITFIPQFSYFLKWRLIESYLMCGFHYRMNTSQECSQF